MQPSWKKWVLENLLRGVPAQSLYQTLREQGFCHYAIEQVLGSNLPVAFSQHQANKSHLARPTPAFLSQVSTNPAVRRLETGNAELFLVEQFLPEPLCDDVVALGKAHLRPSTITTSADDETRAFRTSSTADLAALNSEVSAAVSAHVHRFFQFPKGNDEPIQAQHYAVGQEFKAHTDYFEPGTEEFRRFASVLGQRTWTCMVYLNDVQAGGQTRFTALDISVTPQQGMAVIWNNLLPSGEPNPDTIHHATPVTVGEKMVITKWFRHV